MTITTLHTPGAGQRNPLNTALFVLLSAPFYLNDFANIYIHDWRMWLAIDYVFVKAFRAQEMRTLAAPVPPAGAVTP